MCRVVAAAHTHKAFLWKTVATIQEVENGPSYQTRDTRSGGSSQNIIALSSTTLYITLLEILTPQVNLISLEYRSLHPANIMFLETITEQQDIADNSTSTS